MIEQLINYAEGNNEVIEFINNQIQARIKKGKSVSQGEAEHIIDYLRSEQAPKKLRKASYKDMKRKAEEWLESQKKKGAGVVETEEDVKIIRVFDNGYRFVQLVSKAAFQREGNLMGHCVGSYHGRDGCEIYSLRDNENVPHCTLELLRSNGSINQLKGKGNGPIHPKYISYVIDMCKELGMEIRESELKYLGYSQLSDIMWSIIDRTMKPAKELSFNGKRYLFKHSQLKLRKNVSREDAKAVIREVLKLEA